MASLLAHMQQHGRCGLVAPPSGRAQRRAGLLIPRAQGVNGYSGLQYTAAPGSNQAPQSSGMYYSSSLPPSSQAALPSQQQQYYQTQYHPAGPQQAANQPTQGAQPAYTRYGTPGPQQANQYASPSGNASGGLTRSNPGRNHINSVRLMGTISMPERQGRCTYALIQVPYATKEGIQEFLVEAWDADGTSLLGLHGVQVLVDGRLALNAASVKVVANRIQIVDQTLPPTSYRGGQAAAAAAGEGRTAAAQAVALDPQQVWKMHYSTSTQSLKALASHFGVQPTTVGRVLLSHAFRTNSPLHWGLLAEEAGLGPNDELRLSDFMEMVTQYKHELAAMYDATKPGATPPPLPTTADGVLKVKPIREWARARQTLDTHRYVVEEYERKHGLSKLYEALRMGVIAEATQGVWNAGAELGLA